MFFSFFLRSDIRDKNEIKLNIEDKKDIRRKVKRIIRDEVKWNVKHKKKEAGLNVT